MRALIAPPAFLGVFFLSVCTLSRDPPDPLKITYPCQSWPSPKWRCFCSASERDDKGGLLLSNGFSIRNFQPSLVVVAVSSIEDTTGLGTFSSGRFEPDSRQVVSANDGDPHSQGRFFTATGSWEPFFIVAVVERCTINC